MHVIGRTRQERVHEKLGVFKEEKGGEGGPFFLSASGEQG